MKAWISRDVAADGRELWLYQPQFDTYGGAWVSHKNEPESFQLDSELFPSIQPLPGQCEEVWLKAHSPRE